MAGTYVLFLLAVLIDFTLIVVVNQGFCQNSILRVQIFWE